MMILHVIKLHLRKRPLAHLLIRIRILLRRPIWKRTSPQITPNVLTTTDLGNFIHNTCGERGGMAKSSCLVFQRQEKLLFAKENHSMKRKFWSEMLHHECVIQTSGINDTTNEKEDKKIHICGDGTWKLEIRKQTTLWGFSLDFYLLIGRCIIASMSINFSRKTSLLA